MDACRPAPTPMAAGTETADPGREQADAEQEPAGREFLSINGRIMYAAVTTRPDLAFTTSFLARSSHCATQRHVKAAKHAVRYLKGAANLAPTYKKQDGGLGLRGVVDASWASDPQTSRSTSGYVFFIAGGPVLWRPAIQTTVAQSSTEAEHFAINEAARDAAWIRKFLKEVGQLPEGPILLQNDNNGALSWCRDGETTARQKRHVRIRFDYVKQEIDKGRITVDYVPTEDSAADVLTKALASTKHQRAIQLLGLT